MSDSLVFEINLTLLRSSADWHSCDSELRGDEGFRRHRQRGPPFTEYKNLSDDRNVCSDRYPSKDRLCNNTVAAQYATSLYTLYRHIPFQPMFVRIYSLWRLCHHHYYHSHLSPTPSVFLKPWLSESENPFYRRLSSPTGLITRISGHLMFLFCSTAGSVCMVC